MLDTLARIRIPNRTTAVMQLALLLAQSGHRFWCSDVYQPQHLPKLVAKYPYRLPRDKPGRAYDRRKGLASVHLIVQAEGPLLRWLMMSTAGRQGLADVTMPPPAKVYDLVFAGQHLIWHGYELLRLPKRLPEGKSIETLTWRLQPERLRAHEARLVDRAKHHDRTAVLGHVEALRAMPLFAGIRTQVICLHREAAKVWRKLNPTELPPCPSLPYMVKLPIYDRPPCTLLDLVTG